MCFSKRWILFWVTVRPTEQSLSEVFYHKINILEGPQAGLCLATPDSWGQVVDGSPVSLVDCKDVDAGNSFHIIHGEVCVGANYDPASQTCSATSHSNLCLTAHEIDSNSSWLDIRTCDKSPQQQFTFDTPHFVSSTGQCLDGTSSEDNVPSMQTCNGSGQQSWGFCTEERLGHSYESQCDYQLRVPTIHQCDSQGSSLLCVDVPGGDTSNGALLWTWDCVGNDNQQWIFQDGQLVLRSDASKCVDLLGGDTTNGNLLGIWDCLASDSQQWGFDPDMGTIYLASSAASDASKCMQFGGNPGDNLVIWDCGGDQFGKQVFDIGMWALGAGWQVQV
jgi:hypothetical protein